MRTNHESNFDIENYDEFYEHHLFVPIRPEHSANAHRAFPRVAWALDRAKELKPKKVLDLGCLEGYTLLTLANHVDCTGVGVDLSEDGIKIAEQRAKENNLRGLGWVQDTVENYMATTKNKFDLICAFELAEHVKDEVKFFELIDRVLAPGGTVLISTPDFEAPTYGKDDEKNKCHIRLFTTSDEDYEAENKYGNVRKATSLSKIVGKDRIVNMEVISELINCEYR